MPERTYSSSNYRFGFKSKENDIEYGSLQLIQDYGFRIYDPSISRFLSVVVRMPLPVMCNQCNFCKILIFYFFECVFGHASVAPAAILDLA